MKPRRRDPLDGKERFDDHPRPSVARVEVIERAGAFGVSNGTARETFEQALGHHRAGRVGDAERLYRLVLQGQADHAGALHLMGVVALERGDRAESLDWLCRATSAAPDNAVYRLSLGQTLTALGRLGEAIEAYRAATEIAPDLVDAWFALGISLQRAGRQNDAVGAYRQVLEREPDHADACNNLGSALDQLGDGEQAIGFYRRAIDRQPNFAAAYNNLGLALATRRQLDEAVDVLAQAVALRPDFAEAWYNLGNALFRRAEFNEAADAFGRALSLRPEWAEAHINLGNALQALREFEQAARAYGRALAVRPDDADALNNLGSVQRDLGRIDEAIGTLRRCVAVRPDFHIAHCNLGNALRDTGRIEEAVAAYRKAVELCPADAISHSNLVYAVHFHPDYDGPAILQENRRWNATYAEGLWDRSRGHANDRDPDRRLRIGYLGADFRDHCQSLFTIPLLSQHDHDQFEITCYANVPRPDSFTQRIMRCADRWRVTSGRSDQEVADEIRADGIDILVDLTMHMSNGRPLVLARKPAPVQVAYLAYPGTTGLAAVDYRLTDPYLDPPGDSDA
ncbi:MAG TPA: tetratricopeptide repeat protein, partial [Planctomycetaceae bacterium]|nr:tetratricopeptide repeat protein [Planctomycetaceae bacterium]